MKKLSKFRGTLLATVIIFGMGIFFKGTTCTVYAAQVSSFSVKESQFVTGVYGKSDDGQEMVLALYNNGKKDIAFIRDGNTKFYGTYTVTPKTMTGTTYAERFDVSGVTFTYFEMDNSRFIITDESVVYALEDISAYEVEQLR
ncbi:hypothetical protein SAMN02910298_02397 [Pseudobutyrivibrio sp. YE44]|uniref:hypothetical protein n=1 Tax=Pseudobutyrivibrio sp. YE44 TaxID=1520802 RepID=UPI000887A66C|nr:hypothetical protein [Pseudobutyrivibrio sp. YE44]SDB47863.1 hypothetical protein SAMN02910298_02397 [Pseudobutyrivibrio sp. YE44]